MDNKICAAFKQKKNPTSNEVGFGARYRTRIDLTPYLPVLSGIEKYRE